MREISYILHLVPFIHQYSVTLPLPPVFIHHPFIHPFFTDFHLPIPQVLQFQTTSSSLISSQFLFLQPPTTTICDYTCDYTINLSFYSCDYHDCPSCCSAFCRRDYYDCPSCCPAFGHLRCNAQANRASV